MKAETVNVHIDTLPYRPPLSPDHYKERAAEGGRFVKAGYRRPSDGQPSGAPFDFDEYETRKADRRAAHAAEIETRHAAIKRARQEARDREWDAWYMAGANQDLRGELTCDPKERHRRIWQAVMDSDRVRYIDRCLLGQQSRIFNAQQMQVRGVGAAARRAGFAE